MKMPLPLTGIFLWCWDRVSKLDRILMVLRYEGLRTVWRSAQGRLYAQVLQYKRGLKTDREAGQASAGVTNAVVPPRIGLPLVLVVKHRGRGQPSLRIAAKAASAGNVRRLVIADTGRNIVGARLVAELERNWPEVLVVGGRKMRGAGQTVSASMDLAGGEFVALIADDASVTPGWLDRFLEVLMADSSVSLALPDHLTEDDTKIGAADRLAFEGDESSRDAGERADQCLWATPPEVLTCALVRRSALESIGELDASIDDVDLVWSDFCIRAVLSGQRPVIVRDVRSCRVAPRGRPIWGGGGRPASANAARIFFERQSAIATSPRRRAVRRDGSKPLVSVVLRTRNRPRLLAQALQCLVNQTLDRIEVIVVNDGGIDVSDVLTSVESHLMMKYVSLGNTGGRAAALNAGALECTGEWRVYFDDDDVLYPNHLERLIKALDREAGSLVAFSGSNKAICYWSAQGDSVIERERFLRGALDQRTLKVENRIPFMAIMHHVSCLDRVGSFDMGMDLLEDWDFLVRLSMEYLFRRVPAVTCEYRFRFGDTPGDSTVALRREFAAAQSRIYEKYPSEHLWQDRGRRLAAAAASKIIRDVEMLSKLASDDIEKGLLVTARVGGFSLYRSWRQWQRLRQRTIGSRWPYP